MKHKDTYRIKLSEEAYNVCVLGATEPAYTGKYVNHFEPGQYHCTCCHLPLFDSETKFHSGCGWPSYFDAMSGAVHVDTGSLDEDGGALVQCANCHANLGHLYHDGPEPTGLRYSVNSLALSFIPD